MECEFCKSILKTISSLNYHKKNNKKCLETQKIVTTDNELQITINNLNYENAKLVFNNKTLIYLRPPEMIKR